MITWTREQLDHIDICVIDAVVYDDILEWRYAEGADNGKLASTASYNYRIQLSTHADHAHCASHDRSAPLQFCGADLVTCCGRWT